MNDMVSRWVDLNGMLPHLVAATDEHAFVVWLDKCVAVDPRATLMWLRAHEGELDGMQLGIVRLLYRKVGF